MTVFSKLRNTEKAKLLDEAERQTESHEFFLAGPYIDIEKDASFHENIKSDAHRLRYYLHKSLTDIGHLIYMGEDQELRTIGQKQYKDMNNAVLFERHYILKHLDGVIMLPSSPGSFCELGDWASSEDISKKTLIIVDECHKASASYMNDGVLKFAKFNKAEVEYMDYTRPEAILNVCKNFIATVAVRRRVEKLYGRTSR